MSRVINPHMRSFLLYKNRNDEIYLRALALKNATVLCQLDNRACVGEREATGNNDGFFIELVQETVDGVSAREAYCMAGQQTIVAHSEIEFGVKSRLLSTEHCMTCWRETPAELRVWDASKSKVPAHEVIRPGDIIIWNHVGSDNGHTGMVMEVHDDHFIAVEFNTTAGLGETDTKIVREGGGVYLTNRPYTQVGDMKIVGFLRPF